MPIKPERLGARIGRAAGKLRASSARRGYGRTWQRLRLMVLRRDALCVACGKAAAVEVDHKRAKRDGGIDSLENLQGLCKSCHSRKTARETWGGGSKL